MVKKYATFLAPDGRIYKSEIIDNKVADGKGNIYSIEKLRFYIIDKIEQTETKK
jgi:hypothetical protein